MNNKQFLSWTQSLSVNRVKLGANDENMDADCWRCNLHSKLESAFYLFDNKGQDLKEQANFDDKETAAPRVFWRQQIFNSLPWD